MVVSLNYCSQNGGNLYRAPYYNGNPNIGPRTIGNLDQSRHTLEDHVSGTCHGAHGALGPTALKASKSASLRSVSDPALGGLGFRDPWAPM